MAGGLVQYYSLVGSFEVGHLEERPNDDYPTCEKTFASLLITSAQDELDPNTVTALLEIRPDALIRKTTPSPQGGGSNLNVWSYSTEKRVRSYDLESHLMYLAALVLGKPNEIAGLREAGWVISVSVFWMSRFGHGGPRLSQRTDGDAHGARD
jgi:hypothetical protein